jgi:hypothetical protein
MTEARLQFELILWFGQTHPNHRRLLFQVNNDARTARLELGMIAGVSDLIFITPNGEILVIELKADGTRHNVDHMKNQLSWIKEVQEVGGFGVMSKSLEDMQAIITNLMTGGNVERAVELINLNNNYFINLVQTNKKTVKV